MSCNKVTHDTSSVEENKISLSAFQHCLHCKGPVTEAFLDAVLQAQHPEVLTTFKVGFCLTLHSFMPHFRCRNPF
jgi:hypothetical protein